MTCFVIGRFLVQLMHIKYLIIVVLVAHRVCCCKSIDELKSSLNGTDVSSLNENRFVSDDYEYTRSVQAFPICISVFL